MGTSGSSSSAAGCSAAASAAGAAGSSASASGCAAAAAGSSATGAALTASCTGVFFSTTGSAGAAAGASGSSTLTHTLAGVSFRPRKPVFWGISSTSQLTFRSSACTPSRAQAFARASSTVLPVASCLRIITVHPPLILYPACSARSAARYARPCSAPRPAGGHTPDGACSSRWQKCSFPWSCRSWDR